MSIARPLAVDTLDSRPFQDAPEQRRAPDVAAS
jgi:hypothetical protein